MDNPYCPPRYATKLDAEKAINGQARRLHGRRKTGHGERLVALKCKACHGWHIEFRWAADLRRFGSPAPLRDLRGEAL